MSGRSEDLLTDLFRFPLEPGYAAAAARRAEREAGGSGPPSGARVAGARCGRLIVVVLTGFLFAVAYQQAIAAEPATSQARADLLTDVRDRRAEAEAAQRRADALRERVARAGDRALANTDDGQRLRELAAVTGLGKVVGDGVVVRVVDAPAQVDPVTGQQRGENLGVVVDRDLQDIANELWHLGAEAVAVNGQRLTATATIRAAGGAILVDFRPVTSPYEVTAIGPDDLAARFDASDTAKRFRRYVTGYRMQFGARQRADLTLAAAPDPRLRFARPPAPAGAPSGSAPGPVGPGPSGSGPSGSGPAGPGATPGRAVPSPGPAGPVPSGSGGGG